MREFQRNENFLVNIRTKISRTVKIKFKKTLKLWLFLFGKMVKMEKCPWFYLGFSHTTIIDLKTNLKTCQVKRIFIVYGFKSFRRCYIWLTTFAKIIFFFLLKMKKFSNIIKLSRQPTYFHFPTFKRFHDFSLSLIKSKNR